MSDKREGGYVYMLLCADNTLYTGWTNRVEKRVKTHNAGKGAKYTRSRLPVTLVYQEWCQSRSDAMRREAAIKRLSRVEKLALISRAGKSGFGGEVQLMR